MIELLILSTPVAIFLYALWRLLRRSFNAATSLEYDHAEMPPPASLIDCDRPSIDERERPRFLG
jgi:hypothetical protein